MVIKLHFWMNYFFKLWPKNIFCYTELLPKESKSDSSHAYETIMSMSKKRHQWHEWQFHFLWPWITGLRFLSALNHLFQFCSWFYP